MEKIIFDFYTISENGLVYSKRSKKFLKQSIDRYGYAYVTIKGKHYKVHRLVANSFLNNPQNKPYVDHIDRDKLNNHYSNLNFVTAKENSNNPLTLLHLKQVGARYRREYGRRVTHNGTLFISIIEASRSTGIPRSNIQYHLKNKTGVWEYA